MRTPNSSVNGTSESRISAARVPKQPFVFRGAAGANVALGGSAEEARSDDELECPISDPSDPDAPINSAGATKQRRYSLRVF